MGSGSVWFCRDPTDATAPILDPRDDLDVHSPIMAGRSPRRMSRTLGVALLVCLLAACGTRAPGSSAVTSPPETTARSIGATTVASENGSTRSAASNEADAVAYAAALRYVATLPHEPGAPPPPRVLLVWRSIDRNVAADPGRPDVQGSFDAGQQQAIASRLSDVIPVEFVEDRDSVYLPDSSIRDGGALVTLGTVDLQNDGTVRLGISFTCGPHCAEGDTLVLAPSGDGWSVADVTGPSWIA